MAKDFKGNVLKKGDLVKISTDAYDGIAYFIIVTRLMKKGLIGSSWENRFEIVDINEVENEEFCDLTLSLNGKVIDEMVSISKEFELIKRGQEDDNCRG